VGLPTCFESDSGVSFGAYVWFYNLLHALGMHWYVEQRHSTGVNNLKKFSPLAEEGKSRAELMKDWGFMPGNEPTATADYSEVLKDVPPENLERVKSILAGFKTLVDEFGAKDECKSVDMRPWKAFPER
jgi:hypothetical protein